MTRMGRPPGRLLHTEAFEAIVAAKNLLKKDVSVDAGVTPGYLSDLMAHRCGASDRVIEALSSSLGIVPAAIFPELAEHVWVGPLPDRDARRGAA